MKKAIMAGLLFLLPLSSMAANFAPTPFELLTEVKDNRKEILKIQQQNYCFTFPKRDQAELDKLNSLSTKTDDIVAKIDTIVNNKTIYRDKCSEAERGLLAWEKYTPNLNSNLTCGSGYIKRGDICITPTEACEFYFGKNISGQVDITSVGVATCVCDEGYDMQDNKCVLKAQPQAATVVAANPNSDLQAIINQLMAQVMTLMKQLQASKGL